MDYTQDKYALLKAQWDLIHNPETTTGLFDDMEDGASISDFRAVHPSFEKCGDEVPLCPNVYTYLTPSGLPITLPKRVCQPTFSGQLLNFDHSQKISISKNVLSSFILDGDCYVAESNGTDFLGYVRITINPKLEDPYYEDTYSISNKNNLMVLMPGLDCFSGVKKSFDALKNYQGKYYAKGKLIKVCQYCQKPDCYGECQILCPKCLQPIFKC